MKYSYNVAEITDDGTQDVQSSTIASGYGDAKVTATALRSLADQLDPPAEDPWTAKGKVFGDRFLEELFGGSWKRDATEKRD